VIREGSVRLEDGRSLSYCEWGQADGSPVLHCHGGPGSRLECWGGESVYARAGVRLITTDRPGIGRSDRKAGRTLLDWPVDVAQLADALELDRFAVMGHSMGGAYALACGYGLPERVTGVGLVGAVPPLDRPGGIEQLGTAGYWKTARGRPGLMRASYAGLTLATRFAPPVGHRLFFRHASRADWAVVDRPEVRQRFRATLLEAARPGVRGLVEDMRVLMRPWGFRPEELAVDVRLWHGDGDAHVPRSVGEFYAATIPSCRPTFVNGEGHFSLIEARAAEIAATLVGMGQASGGEGAA
jgi:pimeloyl-ACP methyl ester carboxylesterase